MPSAVNNAAELEQRIKEAGDVVAVKSTIAELERRIREARGRGALFHPTNPLDCYQCSNCSVFGKGEENCWSCGSAEVERQVVPRWGGGAERTSDEEGSGSE